MSEATQWMEMLLRKREMDQRAEAMDEAQNAAQTRQLFQAAGGAAEAMGGAMKQAKLDSIANSLMNEDKPPTATAVDPAIQKQVMADRKAAGLGGPVSPATGGLAEMKLHMAMDGWKQKQMESQLRQEQATQMMGLREQQMERDRRLAISEQRYRAAAQAAPQATRDAMTSADSYYSG